MITEDYASFEVAKLLKNKGFNEETEYIFSNNGKLLKLSYLGIKDLTNADCNEYHTWQFTIEGVASIISAPTHQMVMKWLREIHKTFISITYENDGVFTANLKVPLKGVDCMIDNKHNCWLTYEEAVEASIKYSLENLI